MGKEELMGLDWQDWGEGGTKVRKIDDAKKFEARIWRDC